ncbi:MAG: protein kinase [Gemmatimonadota bacterium]|nr:MAG: protein kinase [Gemmatimonadota bacterium]
MIGKTVSHYKILEKLGEGGMGLVYKAEDTKLKRTVALKFLSPELSRDSEAKSRFIKEAQAVSSLQHNNICNIHEIDETEDRQMFICMDYYDGESLQEKIERGPLKIDETIDIGLQIADGLCEAHEKNIIHRDIKPANIMITRKGQSKIMDFGLARLRDRTKLTKEGTALGTVAYMSPEQARGEEVDHRSDIWSLGVVIYEMITGQPPFKGEYEQAMIFSILNEEAEPMTGLRTGVPMELERIVNKALAKSPDVRYQHADELLADLRRERKQLEDVQKGQLPSENVTKQRKKFSPLLLPAAIVFILALVFLIFKPFQIEIGPQKELTAEENRLAIMYFDNLTDSEDSEKLGEIATNLLITDLTESQYLNVVSSQRLYDVLKLLGREGEKRLDRDVATEVATKARSRWMLLGKILQVEPHIIITSHLVDIETGNAIASQRITGEVGENIFTLVDKLTVEIKNDLSLPTAAQEEADRPIADVTTHSPEAYRYYLEGIEYESKLYWDEAERSFRKALEYDSTLAMAYYQLIGYTTDLEKKKMLAKAIEYSGNATQKEKLWIKSSEAALEGNLPQYVSILERIAERYPDEKEAFYRLGDYYKDFEEYEETSHYYNKAIEIDPSYKLIYNELAYIYDRIGDADKSIWAINKYISLAPGEANPYDTRGDLYANKGKLRQAIESYKKALEIKPDFLVSLPKLGHMYLLNLEYAKAESCYQKMCTSVDKYTRSQGRLYMSYVPLYQGKFEETLGVLNDGIAADRMEHAQGGLYNIGKYGIRVLIYREKKEPGFALKEWKKAFDPEDISEIRSIYVLLLAENNDLEGAEDEVLAYKKEIEEKAPTEMFYYYWAMGYLESVRGNFESAVTNFENAARDYPHYPDIILCFSLAKAYLLVGRWGESVAEFEKILSKYAAQRLFYSIIAVKTYYFLGLAYERSGWTQKAIEQYETFLDIWKNADPGIEEVEDAKARLAALKGVSSK